MRLLLLAAVLLFAPSAMACPTCDSAAMPGLAASDLWSGYPLQYKRSGPKLQLEGAGDRVIAFADKPEPPRLRLYVAGDLLEPMSVAAGFSWQAAPRVGLHVCGPEVTVSVTLP